MGRNVGAVDRSLRAFFVAPVAIVVALFIGAGTLVGIILLVVAAVMLVTAASGSCPTYTVVGISTHPHGIHRAGHGVHAGNA